MVEHGFFPPAQPVIVKGKFFHFFLKKTFGQFVLLVSNFNEMVFDKNENIFLLKVTKYFKVPVHLH